MAALIVNGTITIIHVARWEYSIIDRLIAYFKFGVGSQLVGNVLYDLHLAMQGCHITLLTAVHERSAIKHPLKIWTQHAKQN